jgi:hypothetical protein
MHKRKDEMRYIHELIEDVGIKNILPLNGCPVRLHEKNKVNIIAPVEFYTESDIDLSIRVKNLPENIVVKTIPEKLNVSFLVGLSRYKDIRPSDFILSIDYESLRQSNSNIEAVTLESFPTYIKQPFLKDNKVKWLIEFVEPK